MNDTDILSMIIRNRPMRENIICCSISKLFNEICDNVIIEQSKLFYFLRKFKRRTVFPKKKRFKTYYTLKNIYINREDEPILNFN